MSIKIDHIIFYNYRLWSTLIDFDWFQSTSIGNTKKKRFMAGDKATVAKHSLMKQDWLCQDSVFNRFYIVIGTSNVTTDAERNIGHTNPANLAKEREMSRSSVYLWNLGLIKQIMLNTDENKLSIALLAVIFSHSSLHFARSVSRRITSSTKGLSSFCRLDFRHSLVSDLPSPREPSG